ncbi:MULTISPECIES: AraC family transcriptional regulator [Methylosinus]|uniref:AraC family transcriptional regulator n=2 Tax=Methylosinus trichosporium TaxID=426 RepID=A0A2D2CW57_METT3|nr:MULTISPECIES: helix-turn-helix transcriptional regulator [Methylosinus]ATQ66987.1 AraC family transcriptional regulator [Methylosinus trichosporium OB3b]OBS54047.1 AraC family transcriptional regulator [Methylosinus sp. 3S-1]
MRTLDGEETRRILTAYGLDRPTGIGFAFCDPARNVLYDWHAHAYHQLIYAVDGPTRIETEENRFVLSRTTAAWIPSGTHHRTLVTDADAVSLYFSPNAADKEPSRLKIFAATPLMREMIFFATRWRLGAGDTDPFAQHFLRSLALLCCEQPESEQPFVLPGATHPAIRRAIDYAFGDLAAATQTGAIAAAALSERTFRRLFAHETGSSWQAWLGRARILAAMAALSKGGRVTDVAADVGYSSLSAFAKAFSQICGETPARFRRRRSSQSGSIHRR